MEQVRVAIVGRGLIGGSIELALRRSRPAPDLVVIDSATELTAIADADFVVLAAPILANIDTLARLPDVLAGSALITDTGSTKASIVNAAAGLPARWRFIGGHPVAGAAAGGYSAARADLFDGRRWILTPDARTVPEDLARVRSFVEALGASVVTLDAAEHDRLFAYVSHLPQLAISALMRVAGDAVGERGLELSGPGLRDSTRLAASPAGIWEDVLATNRPDVNAAIDALVNALVQLRDDPDGTNRQAVFAEARRWKQLLDGGDPQ